MCPIFQLAPTHPVFRLKLICKLPMVFKLHCVPRACTLLWIWSLTSSDLSEAKALAGDTQTNQHLRMHTKHLSDRDHQSIEERTSTSTSTSAELVKELAPLATVGAIAKEVAPLPALGALQKEVKAVDAVANEAGTSSTTDALAQKLAASPNVDAFAHELSTSLYATKFTKKRPVANKLKKKILTAMTVEILAKKVVTSPADDALAMEISSTVDAFAKDLVTLPTVNARVTETGSQLTSNVIAKELTTSLTLDALAKKIGTSLATSKFTEELENSRTVDVFAKELVTSPTANAIKKELGNSLSVDIHGHTIVTSTNVNAHLEELATSLTVDVLAKELVISPTFNALAKDFVAAQIFNQFADKPGTSLSVEALAKELETSPIVDAFAKKLVAILTVKVLAKELDTSPIVAEVAIALATHTEDGAMDLWKQAAPLLEDKSNAVLLVRLALDKPTATKYLFKFFEVDYDEPNFFESNAFIKWSDVITKAFEDSKLADKIIFNELDATKLISLLADESTPLDTRMRIETKLLDVWLDPTNKDYMHWLYVWLNSEPNMATNKAKRIADAILAKHPHEVSKIG